MVKLIISIILISLILVASGCTSSTGTGRMTSTLPTTQQECTDVEEPYTVEVPYQAEENYNYYPKVEVLSAKQNTGWDLQKGFYGMGNVKLRNVDTESGWFTVKFMWETLYDSGIDEVRHYIEPDETVDFESIYDVTMGEDVKYTYIHVADPIVKTRTVTKYKIETRYKTVEKCT